MAITQLLQFGCLCEQLLPESEQRHHLMELEADDFIPHCQQPIVLSTLLVHRVETTIRVLLRTVHVECDPRFPAGSGPSCSRETPITDWPQQTVMGVSRLHEGPEPAGHLGSHPTWAVRRGTWMVVPTRCTERVNDTIG